MDHRKRLGLEQIFMSLPVLYTVEETATALKVSSRHVRELAASGRLQVVRVGAKAMRIPHEALMKFLSGDLPLAKTAQLKAMLQPAPMPDWSAMLSKPRR